MVYTPDSTRYGNGMKYSLCGKSGLLLPKVSLGLWHNFGHSDDFENSKSIVEFAFDKGITHFDLANNYGTPAGSAEENFGKIFRKSLSAHRDEIIVSTKAGHLMWDGPYGDGSSRKNLISSLNQSLKRMNLEYVDLFYSHRYDGVTPIEETMQALIDIVKSGKALYAGISKYPPELASTCYRMLESQGVRCLIYQDRYSMLARDVENGALETADRNGIGFCAFSPLAQGLLTDRYLDGIPSNSRVAKNGFLKKEQVTSERVSIIRELNQLALERGETLAQMALSWLLNDARVTTVLVGASSVDQLKNNLDALHTPAFEPEVLEKIREIVSRYPGDIPK
jgi:L-glyceraldehyde 3-phosphate reductase